MTNMKMKKQIKKIANTSLLALALLNPFYQKEADAEVRFTLESANSNFVETRDFANNLPNGRSLQINVYAESTEPIDTSSLEWKVSYPLDMSSNIISSQLTPYILDSEDFFYPNPMSSINYTTPDKSVRTVSANISPTNKKGFVGIYRFNVNTNTALGKRKFAITETKAYDVNSNLQLSSGSEITIEVIPNYDSLNTNANIFIDQIKINDQTKNVPHLFIDHRIQNTKFIIQSSTDLKNWNSIYTNNNFDTEYNMYMPYSFTDFSATNNQFKVYRTKSEKQ